MSKSLELAKEQLNNTVTVTIDRPLGSKHPKWGFEYPINYGYLKGIRAPDGEDLDAYILGVNKPLSEFTGVVTAVIHRLEDDDDKLIVIPEELSISDEEVSNAVEFQEKWFDYEIVR